LGDGAGDAACGSSPPGLSDGSALHKAGDVMRGGHVGAMLSSPCMQMEQCCTASLPPAPRLARFCLGRAIACLLSLPSIVLNLYF